MKKTLIVAAAVAIASIAYRVATREPQFINLPVKETEKVMVNSSADFRTITRAQETAGVQDIHDEILKEKDEEAWSFLPGKNMWIETGSKPGHVNENGKTYLRIQVDNELTRKVLQENDEVVFYHNHPEGFAEFKEVIDQTAAQFTAGVADTAFMQGMIRAMKYQLGMSLAIPSHDDIDTMIRNSVDHHRYHPSANSTEKIVSVHGVTSFRLTTVGIAKFTQAPEVEISAYVNSRPTFGDSYYILANAIMDTPKAAGDSLEALLSDSLMTVTFVAFNSQQKMEGYKVRFGPN